MVLGDPNVSRRHAELRRAGDGVVVTDLGSTNGTRVNGVAGARAAPGERRRDHRRVDHPGVRAVVTGAVGTVLLGASHELLGDRPAAPVAGHRAHLPLLPPGGPGRLGGGPAGRAAPDPRASAAGPPGRRRGRSPATRRRGAGASSSSSRCSSRPTRPGATFDLDDELTVGRSPGCGVPTTYDVYSSTLHARLYRQRRPALGRGPRLDQRHLRELRADHQADEAGQGRPAPGRGDGLRGRRGDRPALGLGHRRRPGPQQPTRTSPSRRRTCSPWPTAWAATPAARWRPGWRSTPCAPPSPRQPTRRRAAARRSPRPTRAVWRQSQDRAEPAGDGDHPDGGGPGGRHGRPRRDRPGQRRRLPGLRLLRGPGHPGHRRPQPGRGEGPPGRADRGRGGGAPAPPHPDPGARAWPRTSTSTCGSSTSRTGTGSCSAATGSPTRSARPRSPSVLAPDGGPGGRRPSRWWRAANEHGGNDNITVVVVDVLVGDGSRGRRGQRAVAGGTPSAGSRRWPAVARTAAGCREPASDRRPPARPPAVAATGRRRAATGTPGRSGPGGRPGHWGGPAAAARARPAADDAAPARAAAPAGAPADGPAQARPPSREPAGAPPAAPAGRDPRRVTFRVLALRAPARRGGGRRRTPRALVRQRQLVRDPRRHHLVVYQGRPGGFLWFKPTLVERTESPPTTGVTYRVAAAPGGQAGAVAGRGHSATSPTSTRSTVPAAHRQRARGDTATTTTTTDPAPPPRRPRTADDHDATVRPPDAPHRAGHHGARPRSGPADGPAHPLAGTGADPLLRRW